MWKMHGVAYYPGRFVLYFAAQVMVGRVKCPSPCWSMRGSEAGAVVGSARGHVMARADARLGLMSTVRVPTSSPAHGIYILRSHIIHEWYSEA